MAELSGTFNAARLAAEAVDVPVELVDTQSASFVVWCAALAAAEAVATGASPTEAAEVVRGVASRCGNVFVVGALDLARAGGRLASDVDEPGSRAWGSQPAHRLAQQPRKGVALNGETGQAAETCRSRLVVARASRCRRTTEAEQIGSDQPSPVHRGEEPVPVVPRGSKPMQ